MVSDVKCKHDGNFVPWLIYTVVVSQEPEAISPTNPIIPIHIEVRRSKMRFFTAAVVAFIAAANVTLAAPVIPEAMGIAVRNPEPQNRNGQVYSFKDKRDPDPQNRNGQVYSAKAKRDPDPQNRNGQVYSAKDKRNPGPEASDEVY